MGETYSGSGVDIDAGEEAVDRIGAAVRSTYRAEVLGELGGFGGLFDVGRLGYDDPILVSTTDGVGTKALVAAAAGRYDSIGLDLVAMCVDDLVCQGAEPLFFLDYISVGAVDPGQIEQLVSGVAEGCRQAGCALIGGEMAEHPGAMAPGEFELVGFAVGAVERSRLLTGASAVPGDVVLALPSPNLRSNGFSLARRVLLERAGLRLDDPAYDGAVTTVADELLAPSIIYSPAICALLSEVEVSAIAHITGGGIPGNLSRVLPATVDARIDTASWEPPRVFGEIQRLGEVAADEMFRVFNMGVGMIVAVPADAAGTAIEVLSGAGHRAIAIGELVGGTGRVDLVDRGMEQLR